MAPLPAPKNKDIPQEGKNKVSILNFLEKIDKASQG